MAMDGRGFNNDPASIYDKRSRRNDRRRNYTYSRASADRSVIGLLVAILAVGLCLLCVSVVGMLGVSTGTANTPPVADTTAPQVVVPENTTATQVVVPETTTAAPIQTPENTTVAPVDDTTTTPVDDTTAAPAPTDGPQTDAEFLEFFNTSLNKLKTETPALTKEKQVKTTDVQLSNPLGQSVVSIVKDKFLSEEVVTTPIAKGDTAAAIANISPDGKDFVSTLTMADIKSITHTTDANGNYVITVNAPDMTSPDPVNSPYAKVFIFLTIDDVMNTYAPDIGATVDRNNVSLVFKDCSATATITPDGKVVAYETTLNINMILQGAKIKVITTDVDASLLSHTVYKDIVW